MIYRISESGAGGFSRRDSSIEFYSRVNALLRPNHAIVDFGAGRGRFLEDSVAYRRDLRTIQNKVKRVVGVDVDSAVLENPTIDEAVIVNPPSAIEIPDSSIDLIVSDFTFEHVDNPHWMQRELGRILRPGGWICARTPNRWGYVGVATRTVPNQFHDFLLGKLQPDKRSIDTFPTQYKINTLKSIQKFFPAHTYDNFSYVYGTDAGYPGGSVLAARGMATLDQIVPERLKSTILIFLRKR